jgi:hypothetical protein
MWWCRRWRSNGGCDGPRPLSSMRSVKHGSPLFAADCDAGWLLLPRGPGEDRIYHLLSVSARSRAPIAACARAAGAELRTCPNWGTVARWRPARATGTSTSIHQHQVSIPSPIASASERWFELGTVRDDTALDETPEGDEQLASERDDADALHSFAFAEAFAKPAGELAARLIPQPAPG